MTPRTRRKIPAQTFALLAPFLGLFLAVGTVFLFWGRLVGDEGFFALAARNVLQGLKPYRDFLFVQTPLLPYVYAAWFAVFGTSIEAGRALALALAAGGATFTFLTCKKLGGAPAAILSGLMMFANLNYLAETCTIKTQGLSVFLLGGAIYFAAPSAAQPLRLGRAAAALAFMSLGLLGRLSLLPALLLLWVYFGWISRARLAAYLGLVALNLLLLGAVAAYFYSGGNMLFDIYRFHQEYFGFPPWSPARAGEFGAGFVKDELPLLVCLTWAIIHFLPRAVLQIRRGRLPPATAFLGFLLASYLGATAIHVINPQSYASHQINLMPLAVAFAAIVAAPYLRLLTRPARRDLLVAAGLLALLAIPLEEWHIYFNGDGSLGTLRQAADIIKANAQPGDTILSFNPELVVATGLASPHGYELSGYTYFPLISDARANRLNLLTARKLLADLAQAKSRILCLTAGSFRTMSLGDVRTGGDPTWGAQATYWINQNYREVAVVHNYGQFFEDLHIFVRRY
jgi:hypothetical protein